jgi:hypothetical protein
MKKQTRKEHLESRAMRELERLRKTGLYYDQAYPAYQSGYKDAMRDMRKIVAHCKADTAYIVDPVLRLERQAFCIRVKIAKFLRPIR